MRGELGVGLTVRETEVLRLVADGLTNGEISKRLAISLNTVRQHLQVVYRKLGVTNRVLAARVVLVG